MVPESDRRTGIPAEPRPDGFHRSFKRPESAMHRDHGNALDFPGLLGSVLRQRPTLGPAKDVMNLVDQIRYLVRFLNEAS
jgi:hypothetical protein